ncbi:antitoxin Xre/MbcA/ParS toxin-binding domain-containing protein [Spirosoma soli]|uniref:Antitoxin Xre/MbcA/ParS toxin-binding domain-containing protein n=1 Tax=Spirosoma soli TaxID=1770529 RepID=A0ABW5MDA9_9BACT
MELTIKVEDKEGPFVIELLKKFSFVQEIKQSERSLVEERTGVLWREKAHKLFASESDFSLWLNTPNQAIQQRTPISMLGDGEGHQVVNKLLGRLEHGIMA